MDDLWGDVAKPKAGEPEMVEVAGERVPVPAIRKESGRIAALATELVVRDAATFREALDFASECSRRERLVDERFAAVDEKTKKAKAASDAARSEVLKLIRELKEPFAEARKIADTKAQTWKRAEDQRLALAAEVKRREEEARLEKERAETAANLRAAGAEDLAEAVEAEPVRVDVVWDKVKAPEGTTFRSHWKAVVTDFALLVMEVSAGRVPMEVLELNQSAADAWARQTKGAVKVQGIIAEDVGGVSRR